MRDKRSPNIVLAYLPSCEPTADQIIRDIVEGQFDRTRRVVTRGELR